MYDTEINNLGMLIPLALISSARNLSIKSAVVTEEADLDRPVTISMSDSDEEDDDQSQTSDSSSEDSSSCDDCQLSKLEEPRSSLPPSVVLGKAIYRKPIFFV